MNGIGTHPARRRRGWSSTWMVARRLASIAQVDPPVDRHVDPPVDRHVDPRVDRHVDPQVDQPEGSRGIGEPAGDPVTPLDGSPGAPPAGTRCVAYVSVGRDDVPFSRSVEQQAAIRAYVTAHGLDVIDLACDIVSGDDDGERTGLEALVRDAPALGATHLIVQDRSRIATRPASGATGATGIATGETGTQPSWHAGLVLIEAEPVHLFRGFRETVPDPPLAWARHLFSTRVDSGRISRMMAGQEPN